VTRNDRHAHAFASLHALPSLIRPPTGAPTRRVRRLHLHRAARRRRHGLHQRRLRQRHRPPPLRRLGRAAGEPPLRRKVRRPAVGRRPAAGRRPGPIRAAGMTGGDGGPHRGGLTWCLREARDADIGRKTLPVVKMMSRTVRIEVCELVKLLGQNQRPHVTREPSCWGMYQPSGGTF
jgi:hypothetical protein